MRRRRMFDFNPVYVVLDPDARAGDSRFRTASFTILVGHGGTAFLKAGVPKGAFHPLGDIDIVIPERPDFDAALLDGLLAFWPQRFSSCPSFAAVEARLRNETRLDFHYHPERIPPEWKALREEARPIFERLEIVKLGGEFLTPIDLERNPRS
jgi:hypothetical protein